MEKFLFFKKIDNLPPTSRLCSLPHKNMVMLYSVIMMAVALLVILGEKLFYRTNIPFDFLFLFSFLSLISFAIPSKKVELSKIFYYFNVFIVYASAIFFLISAFIFVDGFFIRSHYCTDTYVPIIIASLTLIGSFLFTFSLFCYIKENCNEEVSQTTIVLDSSKAQNKFLFFFKIQNINVSKHKDKLLIMLIFSIIFVNVCYAFRFIFNWRDQHACVLTMIFSGVSLLMTLSKNEDLLTINYYVYLVYVIVL